MSANNNSTKFDPAVANVQVAVRCRPPNTDERKSAQPMCLTNDQEAKTVKASYGAPGKKMDKSFNFDQVFGMYSTQEEVYQGIVKPIVQEVLQGFNCTIFAYGQTGTGKTHTMQGDIHSEENAGIVPRAVKAILEQLEAGEAEFTIRVSFLELYNEELQDLLSTSSVSQMKLGGENQKLKLCEDAKKGGVVCQGLEEVTVLTVKDIMEILERGILQRQTAETLCNKNSSRSHSIFTLKINIREYNPDGEEVVRHGQLNLVDLAGSECIGRSGAKNDRAREAGTINQSLLSLGRVITALVDHHSHIPYRDSKLTRLLQDSLGGKAKTCIIATLSPSQGAIEETLSTLDYASRAKNIKNQPQQNQKMTKKVVLREYCAEIEQLRSQLQLTRDKNGVYVNPEEYYNMVAKLANQDSQLVECEGALKRSSEEIKSLKVDRDDLQDKVDTVTETLQVTCASLQRITAECEVVKVQYESTKMELTAAEAVVHEQGHSEVTLTEQGNELLNEVSARSDDIQLLLAKVDKYVGNEQQRVININEFVKKLNQTQQSFNATVVKLTNDCDQHSVTLVNGVGKMLTHGKQSCSSLQLAIDSALTQLKSESQQATNSMAGSCNTLESDMNTTKNTLTTTLTTLQAELHQWLNVVESSVQSTMTELTEQNQLMMENKSIMKDSVATQNSMIKQFLQQHSDFASECVASTIKLQESMVSQIKLNQQRTQSHLQTNTQQFTEQANTLKLQFLSAMDALIQSNTQSNATAVTSNLNDSEQSLVTLNDHCSVMNKQLDTLSNHVDRVIGKELSSHSANVHHQQLAHLQSIAVKNKNALISSQSINLTITERKNNMSNTVHSVVANISNTIDQNCQVVQQTANKSLQLYQTIDSIAGALNQSAGVSLTNFNEMLVGEGTVLEQQLMDHMNTVREVNTEQQSVLLPQMEQQTSAFAKKQVAMKLQPTGKTPTKSQQMKLPFNVQGAPVLVSTRNHSDIKNEVYKGVWSSAQATASASVASSRRSSVSVIPFAELEAESSHSASMDSTDDMDGDVGQSDTWNEVTDQMVIATDCVPVSSELVSPVLTSGASVSTRVSVESTAVSSTADEDDVSVTSINSTASNGDKKPKRKFGSMQQASTTNVNAKETVAVVSKSSATSKIARTSTLEDVHSMDSENMDPVSDVTGVDAVKSPVRKSRASSIAVPAASAATGTSRLSKMVPRKTTSVR